MLLTSILLYILTNTFDFSFQIEPPPHTIFSADQANEALAKIGRGIIPGRAILEFPDEESEE